MCMVANKVRGVRAALAWHPEIARLSRRHNDANVLCLPARFLGIEQALEIVDEWLDTAFEGGRHGRRVDKIMRTEGED
jgi:ribose 5-phosphate isomerase B